MDFERYERARQDYHAAGAFPHLDEKVLWVDPAAPLEGQIPLWRLYRTFGPRWRRRPQAYAALLLGAASKAVFGAWWRVRVLLARRRQRAPAPPTP
jgi:hypothetical protein